MGQMSYMYNYICDWCKELLYVLTCQSDQTLSRDKFNNFTQKCVRKWYVERFASVDDIHVLLSYSVIVLPVEETQDTGNEYMCYPRT